MKACLSEFNKMVCKSLIIKYILLFFGVLFFYISCKKVNLSDISPDLSLKISVGYIYSDSSINAGHQYTLGVFANSANGENLTNLIVESNKQRIFDKGYNRTEIYEEITLTKNLEDIENISIIVFNKARKADTLNILINKLSSSFSSVSRFSNILAGAQENSVYGNYFSLNTGQVYNQANAFLNQELIDLIYYYDESGDANTIASAGANLAEIISGADAPENWLTKRTTRYSRLPHEIDASEFDNATNDSLIISNLFSDGGRKAKNLQNNQFYGFQTNENKFGIVKIENVNGQKEGTIQFSIIVQQ